jgi:hypothetical protein
MDSVRRELRVVVSNNGSPVLHRSVKWALYQGVRTEGNYVALGGSELMADRRNMSMIASDQTVR